MIDLEQALQKQRDSNWKLDILEILWIHFDYNFESHKYYSKKIEALPQWEYFISDLDGTFFRWVLQKEAFSIFSKMIRKLDATKMNIDDYYQFLQDYNFFSTLEKKAYNKEIGYTEYLNAWIYLLLKHRELIPWVDYISEIKRTFSGRKKINPYRFSLAKMKEVLLSGKKFMFISWAPSFIFEIYMNTLREYVSEKVWVEYSKNIYWCGSYINIDSKIVTPMWGKEHKMTFIEAMKTQGIYKSIIWGMWDTRSDFWISYHLNENWIFYFVNPERKVIEEFDFHKKENINYKIIIERKDLLCTIEKENINIIDY